LHNTVNKEQLKNT